MINWQKGCFKSITPNGFSSKQGDFIEQSKRVAPYKGIQDSIGFWIPRRGFRIPGTGFQALSAELGFWIPVAQMGR